MKKISILLMVIAIFSGFLVNAQVSVTNDGSSADPSAMLEVKSSERGFLPPRMTEAQRDAIPNPVAGLIIYCTDCFEMQMYNGTAWVNISGSPAAPANQPPAASNVNFTGNLYVGETLMGSYTYSDFENDPEGTSIYQWYRADDASGTNQAAISGANAITYMVQTADVGKFLALEVTPVAQTGVSPGNPEISAYQGPASNNQPPVASNVNFTGNLYTGQTLTGSYTYSDPETDPEGASVFQWYRADDASGTNQAAISGANAITYMVQAADNGKYLAFEVTPFAQTGTSPGAAAMSAYQGPVTNNLPPVANNVNFNGILGYGSTLTGSYSYFDNEGDPQGTSTFKWYRADDASGTNLQSISGATGTTYVLTSPETRKYVAFEVTPVAQTGSSPGTPVMSIFKGQISPVGANYTPGFGVPSVIIDGVFAPEATQWNNPTYAVGLTNTGTAYSLLYDLEANTNISQIIVQCDCNDTYRIQYSMNGTSWTTLWNVPTLGTTGLRTRNSGTFPTVTARYLRIYATSGDGYYSFSEIELY